LLNKEGTRSSGRTVLRSFPQERDLFVKMIHRIAAQWFGLIGFIGFSVSAMAQPVIITQPQSQVVTSGGDAIFSVTVAASSSSPTLPAVTSGTLQLWLKADAGVITNASGYVSQWQDQSGNSNDASQADTNQQPLLAYPDAILGRSAVRFNGIQDNVHGSYLRGTNSVGIPDAMTSFMFYEMNSVAPSEQMAAFVGIPPIYGASRGYWIPSGTMAFTTWTFDYPTGYTIPTNTYRIWTDRYSTTSGQVTQFDDSGSTETSFTADTSGQSSPAAGYYVGGLDPSVQHVVSGRNFGGDIAELIYYQGLLTEADRLAVLNYLQQKYYLTGTTNGVSFQWQFDGTNIDGATDASLTLTNVQAAEGGTYTVTVSNLAGSSISSSNATLVVVSAPAITSQPQNQEVTQGANVSFAVGASGTPPLSYQWYFNGVALGQATNSTLLLSNVQSGADGSYSVTVTNSYGWAASGTAVLTVDLMPSVCTQPQSQAIAVGANATFSVTVCGSGPTVLPPVNSGTLRLWLKADAGVVTNGVGQVSQWQDQSGNTNHASQANTNLQPTLVSAAGLGGRPVVRFNGIQNGVNGDYLHGTGEVGVPNAMTAFTVYNAFSDVNLTDVAWIIGVPGAVHGASRGLVVLHQQLDFTTWAYDYQTPGVFPTNTYRICTDRVNTNLSMVQIFDTSASGTTNFSLTMANAVTPQAGYYVGGINPSLQWVSPDNWCGDVAEVIIYSGSLSETDRLAVLNYLEQKYYEGGAPAVDLNYQWQFDGTNMDGATNASLTLADVQTNEAGTYTVIVSNLVGSITSSNATLAVGYAPVLVSQPQSQAIPVGGNVTFTASASGTDPISYQWQFDGSNIVGATTTSLSISNVPIAAAGTYQVMAASPYGSVESSNAVLTVLVSTVQIGSSSATGGSSVTIPVQLQAVGTESAVSFSLDYDPSVLTYTGSVLGPDAAGGLLLVTNESGPGRLGVAVALFGTTFSAGEDDVVDVTFQTAVVTNAVITPLTFGSQPVAEQVSDSQADTLLAVFTPGELSISVTALEGDVSPRPNGNEVININDWVQEGRFVVGLDTVSNGSEFQRADCAPRATLGDGQITVADWVQVGRYVVGLDPLTAVGGPTNPVPPQTVSGHPVKTDLPSLVTMVPLSQGAMTNSVAVELAARGTESAVSFSVTFDPTLVRFVNASLGSGATGAVLMQNANLAASGEVGFIVGLMPPATFAAGTQPLVKLNVASVSYSNSTVLAFGDTPVLRQIVDSNAVVLSASFQNATLTVGGLAWPTLAISSAGSNVVLSWPSAAAAFSLTTTPDLTVNWSDVAGVLTTNNGNISATVPISTNQAFYRLQYP
jgi:hypothetical protein